MFERQKKARQNKIRKAHFRQKVCKGIKAGDTLARRDGDVGPGRAGVGATACGGQHSAESRGCSGSLHLSQGEERLNVYICDYFFLFIEFIGVTLVNKVIQVAGAQFHNTSSVPCTVCSPPKPGLGKTYI